MGAVDGVVAAAARDGQADGAGAAVAPAHRCHREVARRIGGVGIGEGRVRQRGFGRALDAAGRRGGAAAGQGCNSKAPMSTVPLTMRRRAALIGGHPAAR